MSRHDEGVRPTVGEWTYSLIIGALAGLLTIVAGILGIVFALVPVLAAVVRRPRPIGLSGVLVGFGGSWLVLLLLAASRCDSASCQAPDLTRWLTIALVCLAIGSALAVAIVFGTL